MIQALIGPVTGLLDKFIEDKDQKISWPMRLLRWQKNKCTKQTWGQLEINKMEAQHRSIFVAGWRPFLGWGLSFAMLWHFVIAPITMFGFAYAGMEPPELPAFDMDSLMTVLLGMLGLGGLRTVEKLKGKLNEFQIITTIFVQARRRE